MIVAPTARLIIFLLPAISVAKLAGGHYRKDYYIPDLVEPFADPPLDGGRVHAVFTNSSCGPVTAATVNGVSALDLPERDVDFTFFDWARLHQTDGRVWLSFHSRNVAWLPAAGQLTSLDIALSDSNGLCDSGTLSIEAEDRALEASYVTTRFDGAQLVVHVANTGEAEAALEGVIVNGVKMDINTNGAHANVAPNQSYVSVFDLDAAIQPGDVWTVSLLALDDGGRTPLSWGGRVVPERFPIQVWPRNGDCPFPGVDDVNANELLAFGIDSVMLTRTNCGDPSELINRLGEENSTLRIATRLEYLQGDENLGAVDAIFIGDEVDDQLDENLRVKLSLGRRANENFPTLPTYQGSKTFSYVGAYSGTADIQGSDAYAAACAPTIQPVQYTLPLDYPFKYLRNARNNHKPLATWLYSQFYSTKWTYQANPNEIMTQIGQAVLAGAKGLQLFQSEHELFENHDVERVATVLRSVGAIRETLRQGAVGHIELSSSADIGTEILAEAIRSPDQVALVLTSINADGYSNIQCNVLLSRHWEFKAFTIGFIRLERLKFGLTNFREVVNGVKVSDPAGVGLKIEEGVLELSGVRFEEDAPVRVFLFDVVH